MLLVDVDLADDEKVNEKFTEEDFDEALRSPTEVTSTRCNLDQQRQALLHRCGDAVYGFARRRHISTRNKIKRTRSLSNAKGSCCPFS